MVSPRLVGYQCQDLRRAGDVPGMCGGGGHSLMSLRSYRRPQREFQLCFQTGIYLAFCRKGKRPLLGGNKLYLFPVK